MQNVLFWRKQTLDRTARLEVFFSSANLRLNGSKKASCDVFFWRIRGLELLFLLLSIHFSQATQSPSSGLVTEGLTGVPFFCILCSVLIPGGHAPPGGGVRHRLILSLVRVGRRHSFCFLFLFLLSGSPFFASHWSDLKVPG